MTRASTAPRGGVARLVATHVIWAPATGSSVPAATVDAARRHGGPRAKGAVCTTPGPGNNDYSLEGWKVPAPVTVHFNPATTRPGLSNVAASLQAAFNEWLVPGHNVPTITVVADGTATSASANHQDDIFFGPLTNGALGVTYTWQWSTGELESDVVLNSRMPWFQAPSEGTGCYPTANAYDVQDVTAHEAGHVYGLGEATNSTYNVMSPYGSLGETYKRTLAPGDILGIEQLY